MARKVLILLLILFSAFLFFLNKDSFGVDENRKLTTGEVVSVKDESGMPVYTISYGEGATFTEAYNFENKLVYNVGDSVIISSNKFEGQDHFLIEEPVRLPLLLGVVALFSALVLMVAGEVGMFALIGLLFTVFLMVFGLIPMILNGYSPLWVTSVLGMIIVGSTVLLSHGVTKKSVAALLGIFFTLLVTLAFAVVVVKFGHISALQDEELQFLLFNLPNLDIVGITIATMILGLLGILDDVAVSQASVVFELNLANSKYSFKDLYLASMRVGRDHIASTVNTLAMAYIGASLPLFLLVFQGSLAELPFVLQFEIMAVELLRIMVGSIGIVMCIPLTNFLACLFVRNDWFKNLEEGKKHVCAHCG